ELDPSRARSLADSGGGSALIHRAVTTHNTQQDDYRKSQLHLSQVSLFNIQDGARFQAIMRSLHGAGFIAVKTGRLRLASETSAWPGASRGKRLHNALSTPPTFFFNRATTFESPILC